MERLPFQATRAGAAYENIRALPISILLDDVRSMYNVGAFFRTADAAGVEKLYLCGITSHPPKHAISKTALGAEERDAMGTRLGRSGRSSIASAPVRVKSRRSRLACMCSGPVRLEAALSGVPYIRT